MNLFRPEAVRKGGIRSNFGLIPLGPNPDRPKSAPAGLRPPRIRLRRAPTAPARRRIRHLPTRHPPDSDAASPYRAPKPAATRNLRYFGPGERNPHPYASLPMPRKAISGRQSGPKHPPRRAYPWSEHSQRLRIPGRSTEAPRTTPNPGPKHLPRLRVLGQGPPGGSKSRAEAPRATRIPKSRRNRCKNWSYFASATGENVE